MFLLIDLSITVIYHNSVIYLLLPHSLTPFFTFSSLDIILFSSKDVISFKGFKIIFLWRWLFTWPPLLNEGEKYPLLNQFIWNIWTVKTIWGLQIKIMVCNRNCLFKKLLKVTLKRFRSFTYFRRRIINFYISSRKRIIWNCLKCWIIIHFIIIMKWISFVFNFYVVWRHIFCTIWETTFNSICFSKNYIEADFTISCGIFSLFYRSNVNTSEIFRYSFLPILNIIYLKCIFLI